MRRTNSINVILIATQILALLGLPMATLLLPTGAEAASVNCLTKAMEELDGAKTGLFDIQTGADPYVFMGVYYGQIWAYNGHSTGMVTIFLSRVDKEPKEEPFGGWWWLDKAGWASWDSTEYPVGAVCVYSLPMAPNSQKAKLYAWLYDPLADVPNLDQ